MSERGPLMTQAEVAEAGPELPSGSADALAFRRQRMQATGEWHPGQVLGRHRAIGCVALEVTQRCNLDCTLCYLSESSEAVRDTPLDEILRRVDAIADLYGPGTDVQITGGDPTLRPLPDLLAIIRRIRSRGLRCSLFTNGIKATRPMLAALAEAGLSDVAFHVDMTQQRKGFDSEAALNAVRVDYLQRARGLGLAVFFNTTVFARNRHEVASLARFFVAHAATVSLASFQLQAETGRGVDGMRPDAVTVEGVTAAIAEGAGTPLAFDALAPGHKRCNRYAAALVAGGRAHDLLDDRAFVRWANQRADGIVFDRRHRGRLVRSLALWLARDPALLARGLPWLARKAWAMRRDIAAGRGRVSKLAFFVHNFMDACALERDRIEACSFMVATADGPVSMCLHNAKRDAFILKPLALADGSTWQPLGRAAGSRKALKGKALARLREGPGTVAR